MSKISIVGVEGSGKTTLMAAFGEKYERPDEYGYGLKAENAQTFRLVKTLTAYMRQGRWPSATELGTLTNLDWTLYRREGANVENVCEVSFLDFAGEVYRRAFGDRPVEKAENQQIAALKKHIESSDALVVLVNLKDIIDGDPASERTTDMLWVSQRILDFAIDTCKIGHVALVFSQFDIYRETVEAVGGLQAAYAKYLPHVEGVRPDLPLLALSAIDKTVVDADGYEVPAHDFSSYGFEELMGWMVRACEKNWLGRAWTWMKSVFSPPLQSWAQKRLVWDVVIFGLIVPCLYCCVGMGNWRHVLWTMILGSGIGVLTDMDVLAQKISVYWKDLSIARISAGSLIGGLCGLAYILLIIFARAGSLVSLTLCLFAVITAFVGGVVGWGEGVVFFFCACVGTGYGIRACVKKNARIGMFITWLFLGVGNKLK